MLNTELVGIVINNYGFPGQAIIGFVVENWYSGTGFSPSTSAVSSEFLFHQ